MTHPPHGLIDELLTALVYDREAEVWSFGERFEAVAKQVRAIRDPRELLELTWDLLRLGYFLDVRRRSGEAADAVLALVRSITPTLLDDELGHNRWETARQKLEDARRAPAHAVGLRDTKAGVDLRRAKKSR